MLVISGTDPATTVTESWNGSSWTEITEVNTGRYRGQAAGVNNSDTLFYSGSLTPGTAQAKTEQWNGSTWTEVEIQHKQENGPVEMAHLQLLGQWEETLVQEVVKQLRQKYGIYQILKLKQ